MLSTETGIAEDNISRLAEIMVNCRQVIVTRLYYLLRLRWPTDQENRQLGENCGKRLRRVAVHVAYFLDPRGDKGNTTQNLEHG